jgi:hypothetical protein
MTLRGSAHGATLRGDAFVERWGDRNSTALLRYNQANMPPGSADSLSESQHLAVVAYLLRSNGLELAQALSADAPVAIRRATNPDSLTGQWKTLSQSPRPCWQTRRRLTG